MDYGVITATDDVDGIVSTTCNYASGSVFPLGSTLVICTAVDSALPVPNTGNGIALTITVQDTTAPDVVISPSSQNLATTSPSGTEALYTASATDMVDGTIPLVVCSPVSGSVFSLGTTVVSCAAHDSHGNSVTSTATVTVYFIDLIPPVITLNGDANINLTVGNPYVEQGATVSDNYDHEVAVHIGGDVVNTSVVGTYHVLYEARDAGGNAATQQVRTIIVSAPAPENGGGGVSGLGSPFVEPTPPSFGDHPITVGGGLGNTSTVVLTFDVTNASWIAISETPDFNGSSWILYTTSTTFTLSASNTTHILYIKFRRINGGETKVQEVTVLPNSPATLIQAVLGIKITRLNELANKLKFGNRGAEVKELQALLKQAGYFPARQIATGYYGPITRASVKKYLAAIKQ